MKLTKLIKLSLLVSAMASFAVKPSIAQFIPPPTPITPTFCPVNAVGGVIQNVTGKLEGVGVVQSQIEETKRTLRSGPSTVAEMKKYGKSFDKTLTTLPKPKISRTQSAGNPAGENENKNAPVNFVSMPESELKGPYAGTEGDIEALAALSPFDMAVSEALDVHNLLYSLPSRKEIFDQYREAEKQHQEAIKALEVSDKAVQYFFGHYYEDPKIPWAGGELPPIKDNEPSVTNHEARKGVSAYALAAYDAAKAASVLYASPSRQYPHNVALGEYPEINLDGAQPEPPLVSNDELATSEVDSNTDNSDIGAAESKANASLPSEEEGVNSVNNPNKLGEIESDLRLADKLKWDIGAEAVKMLLADQFLPEDERSWKGIKKDAEGKEQKFAIWHDQKAFYDQYIEGKYNNIKEYVASMDLRKPAWNLSFGMNNILPVSVTPLPEGVSGDEVKILGVKELAGLKGKLEAVLAVYEKAKEPVFDAVEAANNLRAQRKQEIADILGKTVGRKEAIKAEIKKKGDEIAAIADKMNEDNAVVNAMRDRQKSLRDFYVERDKRIADTVDFYKNEEGLDEYQQQAKDITLKEIQEESIRRTQAFYCGSIPDEEYRAKKEENKEYWAEYHNNCGLPADIAGVADALIKKLKIETNLEAASDSIAVGLLKKDAEKEVLVLNITDEQTIKTPDDVEAADKSKNLGAEMNTEAAATEKNDREGKKGCADYQPDYKAACADDEEKTGTFTPETGLTCYTCSLKEEENAAWVAGNNVWKDEKDILTIKFLQDRVVAKKTEADGKRTEITELTNELNGLDETSDANYIEPIKKLDDVINGKLGVEEQNALKAMDTLLKKASDESLENIYKEKWLPENQEDNSRQAEFNTGFVEDGTLRQFSNEILSITPAVVPVTYDEVRRAVNSAVVGNNEEETRTSLKAAITAALNTTLNNEENVYSPLIADANQAAAAAARFAEQGINSSGYYLVKSKSDFLASSYEALKKERIKAISEYLIPAINTALASVQTYEVWKAANTPAAIPDMPVVPEPTLQEWLNEVKTKVLSAISAREQSDTTSLNGLNNSVQVVANERAQLNTNIEAFNKIYKDDSKPEVSEGLEAVDLSLTGIDRTYNKLADAVNQIEVGATVAATRKAMGEVLGDALGGMKKELYDTYDESRKNAEGLEEDEPGAGYAELAKIYSNAGTARGGDNGDIDKLKNAINALDQTKLDDEELNVWFYKLKGNILNEIQAAKTIRLNNFLKATQAAIENIGNILPQAEEAATEVRAAAGKLVDETYGPEGSIKGLGDGMYVSPQSNQPNNVADKHNLLMENLKAIPVDYFPDVKTLFAGVEGTTVDSLLKAAGAIYSKVLMEDACQVCAEGSESKTCQGLPIPTEPAEAEAEACKIVDKTYFLGLVAQARDLRAPAKPDDANLPPVRENLYFDDVNYKQMQQMEVEEEGTKKDVIVRESLLNAGAALPSVWDKILDRDIFVETNINLEKILVGDGSEEDKDKARERTDFHLVSGGIYPCEAYRCDDENKNTEYLVSVGVESVSTPAKKIGPITLKSARKDIYFNYQLDTDTNTASVDYPTCQAVCVRVEAETSGFLNRNTETVYRINDLEAGINGDSHIRNRVLPSSTEEMEDMLDSIGESSELGMITGIGKVKVLDMQVGSFQKISVVEDQLMLTDTFKAIFTKIEDALKRSKNDDEDDRYLEDEIAKRALFKNNQVGDFLKYVDMEREAAKNKAKILAEMESSRTDLITAIQEVLPNYQAPENLDLSDSTQYGNLRGELAKIKSDKLATANTKKTEVGQTSGMADMAEIVKKRFAAIENTQSVLETDSQYRYTDYQNQPWYNEALLTLSRDTRCAATEEENFKIPCADVVSKLNQEIVNREAAYEHEKTAAEKENKLAPFCAVYY